jgi:hypothetical protein
VWLAFHVFVIRTRHRQTEDGHRPALPRLPAVVDLEKLARFHMAKRPTIAQISKLIKTRGALDRQIDDTLSDHVTGLKLATGRPAIQVSHNDVVALRVVRSGVIYMVAFNLTPLPLQASGLYQFTLLPGTTDGLLWTVHQTQDPWAYQIDLIVNDQVILLDRQRSADGTAALPKTDQQPLVVL